MPSKTPRAIKARTQPAGSSVAVAVSRYNATITDALLAGALEAYANAGGDPSEVMVLEAPGSFELPALACAAAQSGRYAGVLTLGCIIRGETIHDQVIAHAVARGIMDVIVKTGVPVALGVLTVDTVEQAQARAGGDKGNKGAEAMEALLQTMEQIERLKHDGGEKPTRSFRVNDMARPDKAAKAGNARNGRAAVARGRA